MNSFKYLIMYLISLVIMGSNGIVAHYIELNSYEIVLMRTIIGSLSMIIVCILCREKFKCLKNKKDVLRLIGSGFALGGGWIFLFEAYRQVGVGVSTLLYYCGPMLAMLLSPIFFKEKLTVTKIIGFIVVVIGVLLLNGKLATDATKYFGIFCGMMSAVLYALMVILNKKVKSATGIENTTFQLITSFVLVFLFMHARGGVHMNIVGKQWVPVLWIGVINTGISCFLYYSSIPKLPIFTVAICSYLDPVSAVILSMIILGEKLSIVQFIGVICIIGGAAFSQVYKGKLLSFCKNRDK